MADDKEPFEKVIESLRMLTEELTELENILESMIKNTSHDPGTIDLTGN